MSPMSMTAEAARRALDAAKRNAQFVKRYLDGDRQAFAHMQGLMRAAYPDEGLGESPGAADDSESFSSAKTTAPMGDGTGEAMPRWLIEAGDAGFAPPKSPAHYKFEYAPNVEIDSEFDRLAREWMFKAELPAGWSTEIARDYQRRAAKPLSAAELAQERDAVLGRLRRHWGEETDAKLSQVRDLVHGVGDERLIETLNRSGLGNNEWPIRQLAIFADRKAMKAAEREKAEAGEEPEPSGDTGAGYRDIVYRQGDIQSSPYAQVAYKSGGDSIGETIDPEIVPVSSNEETGERRSVKHKDHSGGGRSGGGWGEIEITGERPIAVIVDTPDGPYLMRDTRNGEIKVQRGKAAHRLSRDEVRSRNMYLDYPPSVDEAKAIEERLDRGEELDAPTRDSARFPRAGHLVAVQYPNGEVHYLRNAKGEYLHAPGGEDLTIPAEEALDLGLGDLGMFQPPRPENKPVFPTTHSNLKISASIAQFARPATMDHKASDVPAGHGNI